MVKTELLVQTLYHFQANVVLICTTQIKIVTSGEAVQQSIRPGCLAEANLQPWLGFYIQVSVVSPLSLCIKS